MTREEILAAAAQIFREKGFHATSMQDIAIAVNLQKASLYHHISSKQEILLALLDRALELLISKMQEVLNFPMPPDEKLRRAIQEYLETLLEERDLASVLLLEHRSLDPEYHAKHIPKRDQFEILWRVLIQEGQSKNLFNSTDVGLVSRSLLGVLNWTITWYRDNGSFTPAELAKQYAELFLYGLVIRKDIDAPG